MEDSVPIVGNHGLISGNWGPGTRVDKNVGQVLKQIFL